MGVQDILLLFFVLAGSGALLWFWVFPRTSSRFLRIQLLLLWLYHFLFSWIYHFYLSSVGGDAIRYWEVSADLSQYAQSWMGYFGFSTFFIQWLNYIPSQVLGLNFLSGNLIYGLFSYLGIVLGVWITDKVFRPMDLPFWIKVLPFLIWWFPGLHFWTAGVSKDTLLFLGLMGVWYTRVFIPQKIYVLAIFWLLIFMIKPLIGILLLPFLLLMYWKEFWINWKVGLGLLVLFSPVIFLGGRWLWVYSHMEAFSISDLLRFSEEQLSFLASYGANSALPMLDYSLTWRMISFLFRPFIWEVWDGFSLVFALENSLLLLLLVCSILFGIKYLKSFSLSLGLLFCFTILIAFIYSMTLNNYGLFYRMKSVWLPFLYIGLLWLIWPFIIRKFR